MKQRINISRLEPGAYKAVLGIRKYLDRTGLDENLRNLINIRASQINGCAYCLEIHTSEALKEKELPKRIFALSAWWESPLFSDKEKALLRITEEVTLISDKGLSEKSFQDGRKFFSDHEIAQIIIHIGEVNIWNRIAISTHMFHSDQNQEE